MCALRLVVHPSIHIHLPYRFLRLSCCLFCAWCWSFPEKNCTLYEHIGFSGCVRFECPSKSVFFPEVVVIQALRAGKQANDSFSFTADRTRFRYLNRIVFSSAGLGAIAVVLCLPACVPVFCGQYGIGAGFPDVSQPRAAKWDTKAIHSELTQSQPNGETWWAVEEEIRHKEEPTDRNTRTCLLFDYRFVCV